VKLVRKGQLEEAEECHLRAAEILKGIKEKLESDSLCRRSLEAQVEFHERQAALVIFLKYVTGSIKPCVFEYSVSYVNIYSKIQ